MVDDTHLEQARPALSKNLDRRSLLKRAGALGAGLALGRGSGESVHAQSAEVWKTFVESVEFQDIKTKFQDRSGAYVDLLNSGVDTVKAIKPEENTDDTKWKHVTKDEFLYSPDGYSRVNWYLDKPQYIEGDMKNPNDFRRLLTDEPSRKASIDDYSPALEYDAGLPGQDWLGLFTTDIVRTMMRKDTQRVRKTVLGNRNTTSQEFGEVEWAAKVYSEKKIPFDLGAVQQLVHEYTHAAVPHFRQVRAEGEQKFEWGLESGSVPTVQEFDEMWAKTFLSNPDFFKRRFFDAQGDMLYSLIRDGGGLGMRSAISEFQGMLCTDLALPSENMPIKPEDWSPDVMDTVLRTWNFVLNGVDSNLIPVDRMLIIGEDQIGETKPVRKELLRATHDYQRIFSEQITPEAGTTATTT